MCVFTHVVEKICLSMMYIVILVLCESGGPFANSGDVVFQISLHARGKWHMRKVCKCILCWWHEVILVPCYTCISTVLNQILLSISWIETETPWNTETNQAPVAEYVWLWNLKHFLKSTGDNTVNFSHYRREHKFTGKFSQLVKTCSFPAAYRTFDNFLKYAKHENSSIQEIPRPLSSFSLATTVIIPPELISFFSYHGNLRDDTRGHSPGLGHDILNIYVILHCTLAYMGYFLINA